jgi:hypothetical protein
MIVNLRTFVKAEMLIRVEDLAFILCWADEAGRVIGFVVPMPFSLSSVILNKLVWHKLAQVI